MAESIQQFFTACPESIGQAREFITTALAGWGLHGRVEDIQVCVSELATNALVHGTTPGHGFLVKLDADDVVVRLEVHDSLREPPRVRQAADMDLSGRGLTLVDALADGWGVMERTPFGKIVWSLFKAAGTASC